jgi:hypothetical protein
MNLNSKLVTGICGATAVAVIGTGGYLMASSTNSSSSGPAGSSGSSGVSAGSTRDDAITMTDGSFLDVALAAADQSDQTDQSDQSGQSDSAAPEATAKPGGQHPRLTRHPLRARHFLRGIHGTATVRIKDGGFTEVAWQRGQLTAVSGSTLTVRSADGTTWQWVTNANTKVRRHGEKASVSRLAANDRVFVIGTLDGSTRTARAAVAPKAR